MLYVGLRKYLEIEIFDYEIFTGTYIHIIKTFLKNQIKHTVHRKYRYKKKKHTFPNSEDLKRIKLNGLLNPFNNLIKT